MIQLWLAQGCLVATHDGESLEDVGEEYFSILLQRCFFEDVDGSHGEVLFCKMHDRIHDLAQEVAGEESLMLTVGRENTRNITHQVNEWLGEIWSIHLVEHWRCLHVQVPHRKGG